MGLEEGVFEEAELSHERGESGLGGLAGFDKLCVFGLEVWIEARGGWHGKGPADAGPSAANESAAGPA
ncbi:MAG: hypothetical protein DLM68_16380 [Hyphomicrobiales bacterium]|nr:MAG: hypothetical protein DLM68_16380 [Hyphomicrobiales bacterium]